MPSLTDSIATPLHEQAHRELENSNYYLHAAFWFDFRNFEGIATWLRNEAESERKHALKLFDYLIKRGRDVNIGSVNIEKKNWDTPTAVFETVLELEEATTQSINELMTQAKKENDHGTEAFLQWFVVEQYEAEAEVNRVLEKVKAYAAMPGLLYHLDVELKTSAGSQTASEPVNV